MVWDFAESNPFGDGSGDYTLSVYNMMRVIDEAVLPATEACVFQAAAQKPMARACPTVVSTDPPYYDNIAYADLSDYFYVWLRRSLRSVFGSVLLRTVLVPKAEELIATAHRFGGDHELAKAFFEDGLAASFDEIRVSSVSETPITVYYAFKQSEEEDEEGNAPQDAPSSTTVSTGWETMLGSLVGAGLTVEGTWPVRTERGTRSISIGTNALASSIVLVCRKRPDDAPTTTRTEFRRLLRQELPAALKNLQRGNIAPVDMAQASIGPGMAIFSRHSKVLEADGSSMTVRTALQLINQALDEYLTEQEGEFDGDTRFAVTWFETHAFDAGQFGEAETLAKARNVSVSGVVEAGILSATAGKVRLLTRKELPDDWDPATDKRLTVWECTQQVIKRLDDKGEEAAADLLARLGSRADPARDLAYRLYTTCERKGWAEEAGAYNRLVVAWSEVEKLAGKSKAAPAYTKNGELGL